MKKIIYILISLSVFQFTFTLNAEPLFNLKFKKYIGKISYYFTNQPLIYKNIIIYAGQGDKPTDDKYDRLTIYNSKGKELWSFPATSTTTKSSNIQGVVADKERIYISSDNGIIYAVSLTGTIKWQFKTAGKVKAFTIGDINNDGKNELLAGSWDHNLYAISFTGSVIWKKDLLGAVDCSPIIFNKNKNILIAVGSNAGGLFILNNKGETVDFFQAKDSVKSSPVIFYNKKGDDFRIIFGSDDGNLYILNKDFKRINKFKIKDRFISSPTLADINNDGIPEIFISGDNKRFYGLTVSDNIILKKEFKTGIMASPLLLKYKNKPVILLADLDGLIKLINLKGNTIWSYKTNDMIFSTPAIGDPDYNGKVNFVVPSGDGYLYYFEASTSVITPIWSRWHGDNKGSGIYKNAINFSSINITKSVIKTEKLTEESNKERLNYINKEKNDGFFNRIINCIKRILFSKEKIK